MEQNILTGGRAGMQLQPSSAVNQDCSPLPPQPLPTTTTSHHNHLPPQPPPTINTTSPPHILKRYHVREELRCDPRRCPAKTLAVTAARSARTESNIMNRMKEEFISCAEWILIYGSLVLLASRVTWWRQPCSCNTNNIAHSLG